MRGKKKEFGRLYPYLLIRVIYVSEKNVKVGTIIPLPVLEHSFLVLPFVLHSTLHSLFHPSFLVHP